ncbi:MAG: ROK family protein [Sarcina sp.]
MKLNYLAIDIGGTNIKYGIVDSEGRIIEKNKIKTKKNGDKIIELICNLYNGFSQSYILEGIAISAPGIINQYTGYMQTGGAINDFDDFNLKEHLENLLNVKVAICNDANCVVLAEKWTGNAKDCKNFAVLTIGTGVGGGIFINNELYTGSSFIAGEFGFMGVMGINNIVPTKTNMNSKASMRGLRENYAERINKDVEEIDGEEIFTEYESGNIHARLAIDDFYNNLAIGLNNIFFILNPEKILIGGAVSEREEIIDEIKKRINILSFMGEKFVLEKCKFSNDSGIIGAVKNFIDRKKETF